MSTFGSPSTTTADKSASLSGSSLFGLLTGRATDTPPAEKPKWTWPFSTIDEKLPTNPAPPLGQNAPKPAATAPFWSNGSSLLMNRGVFVAVVVVAILLAVAFVVWLIARIRSSNRQDVTMTSDVLPLTQTTVLDKASIPATVNGQEYAYGFWIYLEGLDPTTTPKLVLMRSPDVQNGQANTVYGKANPVVLMHQSTNRMYVSLPTTNAAAGDVQTLSDLLPENGDNKVVTVTIDYVPLQRWVFFAVSVRDNTVTVFMDGDIYAVQTIAEVAGQTRPVYQGTSGTVQVGDATNPIHGYVSKVTFANYAITQRQAYAMYREGPQPRTFLSRFGLPPYGLRSPIYRLNAYVK
jgi:hypothetical protein